MSFAGWHHFIAARGSDWSYPRAVLRLEQGLRVFLLLMLLCCCCVDEAKDSKAVEATAASSASDGHLKIAAAVSGTELAFIDDLLRPDPVAVVIKVGHVISPRQNAELELTVSWLQLNK